MPAPSSARRRRPSFDRLDARTLLSGVPLPNDAGTILLLHADGTLGGASGEAPSSVTGVSYEAGLLGQAARFGDPGTATFAAAGNVSPASGSVEFWIKPGWDGSPTTTHTFLQVGSPFDNGMVVVVDGASNLRLIRWGDDPATPAVETSVERGVGFGVGDWKAGAWRHVAATWDAATHRMALYLDGRQVATGDDVALASFSGATLTLGSGPGGVTPADAAFDELRISDRARTSAEVFAGVRSVRGTPPAGPTPPAGVVADAINPKVLLFVYDPVMENKGGARQHAVYGHNDPIALTSQVVADLKASSHGLVNYQVVDSQVVDAYPYLKDGFRYDDASYDLAMTTGVFHNEQHGFPNSGFDYNRFIADNGIAARIESGEIDEVWLWTGNTDASGTWESTMAGDGAYWVNSPPVAGVDSSRAFVVMGWNFERGVAEALHSYGHRTESIMSRAYGRWRPDQDDNWSKFALLDKDAPGLGGVGNVHYPVNSVAEYRYDEPKVVVSNADDWYNYPNFLGTTRRFNSSEWSPTHVDPERDYLNWWYDHMPHMAGLGNDGYLANWWRYIADVDQFKGSNANLAATSGIPTVSLARPADGSPFRATASADGALGRVDFYVDGVFAASDSLAPFTFDWQALGRTGAHTIVAKAYELQNGTEAVSNTVVVGRDPDEAEVYFDRGAAGVWAWATGRDAWKVDDLDPRRMILGRDGTLYVITAAADILRRSDGAFSAPIFSGAENLTTAPDGSLYADLGGLGLWRLSPSGQTERINAANPENFIVGADGTLYVDYGPFGLWRRDAAGFARLNAANPEGLAVSSDGALYVDYGPYGFWRRDARGFIKVNGANPEKLVAGANGVVFVDFGPFGLWAWSNGFTRLNGANPEAMTVAPDGTLFVDYGPFGLWSWVAGSFVKLNNANPQDFLVTRGGLLVIDFGPFGVWRRGPGGAIALIASFDPQGLAG